jgi:hypothetical protein
VAVVLVVLVVFALIAVVVVVVVVVLVVVVVGWAVQGVQEAWLGIQVVVGSHQHQWLPPPCPVPPLGLLGLQYLP